MIRILLSRKLGELRWTQADLARATGIRANTINELYHEVTDKVSLTQLDLICKALNCDLSEIVQSVPDNEIEVLTRLGKVKSKKGHCNVHK